MASIIKQEWVDTKGQQQVLYDAYVTKRGYLAVKFNDDVMAMSAMTDHKSLQMLKRYIHLRAEKLAARLG